MNNTQLASRIAATLSDGTRIDVTPTEAISLSSVVELHSVIRSIVPSNKKGLAITSATAYGSDNKVISLPIVAVTEANTSKEDTNMNKKTRAELEEELKAARACGVKIADKMFRTEDEAARDVLNEELNTIAGRLVELTDELSGEADIEPETESNESFFDKEFDATVEELEAAVEEAVKDLKGAKAKQYIKALFSADDKDVYDTLLRSINGAVHNSSIAMSTRRKLKDNFSKIDAKSFLILDGVDVSKKAEVLAKLKLMITLVVRKTLALLEGTAFFVFDATSILGVMVSRIAYTTAREVVYASSSLISAFKGDILEHVKQA